MPLPVEPVSTTPPPPVVDILLGCDFENASRPLCSFQQDVDDSTGIWTRVNASDPPSSSHPVADHTFRNGMLSREHVPVLRCKAVKWSKVLLVSRLSYMVPSGHNNFTTTGCSLEPILRC